MAFQNFLLLSLVAACTSAVAYGNLSVNYYSSTCPKALSIIHAGATAAIKKEPRMGASLLRLHFHDCFVNVSMFLLFTYSALCDHSTNVVIITGLRRIDPVR